MLLPLEGSMMRPDTESEFKKEPGGIIMSINIILYAEHQLMFVLYVPVHTKTTLIRCILPSPPGQTKHLLSHRFQGLTDNSLLISASFLFSKAFAAELSAQENGLLSTVFDCNASARSIEANDTLPTQFAVSEFHMRLERKWEILTMVNPTRMFPKLTRNSGTCLQVQLPLGAILQAVL